jgi:Fe-S-cluster containining protein
MDAENRELLDWSRSNKKQIRTLTKSLKKDKSGKIDHDFSALHEEAFEKIDCLTCANCCKTTSPIFLKSDIDRLSKVFKMKPSDFIDTYLREDEEGDFVLQSSPCPFLLEDNTCLVYEDRPKACREYPHTNRKKMHQIMDLTYRNSQMCPAVSYIMQKLLRQ